MEIKGWNKFHMVSAVSTINPFNTKRFIIFHFCYLEVAIDVAFATTMYKTRKYSVGL